MKIAVIGAGMVGSSAAYSLVMAGVATEIVLIDANARLAQTQAEDILHAIPFASYARVSTGDYNQLHSADVVLLCCGVAQALGESRLRLLQRNVAVMREIVPRVIAAAPEAVLVVASNPVDIVTDVTAKIARLPPGRVIGSGTVLDSARMRALLGEHLGVAADSVQANVVGEHGDSSVLVWSSIQVGVVPLASFAPQVGRPVTEDVKRQIENGVRRAAYRIVEGKSATNFGLGAALARIVRAIRDDEKALLTLSAPVDGSDTLNGNCFSLPRILGCRGIEATLQPSFSATETAALQHSIRMLQDAAKVLKY